MAITYDDIARVNSEMTRVKIFKNDYATVSARVQAFRKLCPEGRIETDIRMLNPKVTRNEDGEILKTQQVVMCIAKIYAPYIPEPVAKGHAVEVEGSSNINTGSFVENCETSAVGRALGFLGIGSDDDIASAEEVINAQGYDTISQEKADILRQILKEKGKDEKYACKYHGVKKLEELTMKQFREVMNWAQ